MVNGGSDLCQTAIANQLVHNALLCDWLLVHGKGLLWRPACESNAPRPKNGRVLYWWLLYIFVPSPPYSPAVDPFDVSPKKLTVKKWGKALQELDKFLAFMEETSVHRWVTLSILWSFFSKALTSSCIWCAEDGDAEPDVDLMSYKVVATESFMDATCEGDFSFFLNLNAVPMNSAPG